MYLLVSPHYYAVSNKKEIIKFGAAITCWKGINGKYLTSLILQKDENVPTTKNTFPREPLL